jgi:FkbH-like protein
VGVDLGSLTRLEAILLPQIQSISREWTERHLAVDLVRQSVEVDLGSDPNAYATRFVEPVLRVLMSYLRTGDRRFADIYTDERNRYLTGPAAVNGAETCLPRLIPADEASLIACVPDEMKSSLTSILVTLHSGLLAQSGKSVSVLFVGDCLMTEIRAGLAGRLRDHGITLNSRHCYFSRSGGVGLATDPVLTEVAAIKADMIAASFMTFDGVPAFSALRADANRMSASARDSAVDEAMEVIRGFVDQIRTSTSIPILLHGVAGLPASKFRRRLKFVPFHSRKERMLLDSLNRELRTFAEHVENCIFIDEQAVSENAGGLRAVSAPMFDAQTTKNAVFHHSLFGASVGDSYAKVISAYSILKATKVLLVDFDNTLWKGVMAEGEVQHDRHGQKLLRTLKEAGIVLVAVSKNDIGSIRWSEMELQQDDFALLEINWGQKSESIDRAIQLLDLAPDSFVLLDDNPVERDLVRQAHPKINSLDPTDPGTWQALQFMLDFPSTRATEEASNRTAMYREAAARRQELQGGTRDYDSMMASLKIEVEIRDAAASDLDRIHELTQRTNQFNTTTIRYTPIELASLVTDPLGRVRIATLKDRFGDFGLVGVVIARRTDRQVQLESVVMSCRAMGFEVERAMIEMLLSAEHEWDEAIGSIRPTERNAPCQDLYHRLGFHRVDDEHWSLPIGKLNHDLPSWLTVSNSVRIAKPA